MKLYEFQALDGDLLVEPDYSPLGKVHSIAPAPRAESTVVELRSSGAFAPASIVISACTYDGNFVAIDVASDDLGDAIGLSGTRIASHANSLGANWQGWGPSLEQVW